MKHKIITIAFFLLVLSISTGAQKVTLQFEFNGVNRVCNVYTPTNYDDTQSYPLLFAFHGMSRSADLMEYHTHLSTKAEEEGFIVAYPQMRVPANGWQYTGDSPNDVDFAMFLLDSLLAKYNIDEKKVYSTGFSHGANFTAKLAYQHSDRIAAIATVAGFVKESEPNPHRSIPIMHFHAKNDPYVSYSTTKSSLQYWIEFNECNTEADTILNIDGAVGEKWSSSKERDVILYTTTIGGHSWPGGEESWHQPCDLISATDLMWDFFKQYQLTEVTAIEEPGTIESDFILEQNYPNPFNPATTISYNLPEASKVQLRVYDLLGNLVATLVNGEQPAGLRSVNFNTNQIQGMGGKLSSGVYFYRIETPKYVAAKKLILLK
ncbi:MAG: T9SS type A sorting domain-containing protein [Ignavibacteria bacterium]|jgi:polyhydroxybutyrate depolymerase